MVVPAPVFKSKGFFFSYIIYILQNSNSNLHSIKRLSNSTIFLVLSV